MVYDYVIVGGGAAGCVLAERLSARSGTSVLLIEAGIDFPPGREPDDILDSFPGRAYFSPDYTWTGLRVHLQALPHNAPPPAPDRRYEQGRLMGGGSSINGQIALRGAPEDYDRWAELGAAGWGWADVLPYFQKLEWDMDFAGPCHGKSGRIPIRRLFPDVWCGFSRAAAEAFRRAGYAYQADMNEAFVEAYAPTPFSNAFDRRVSTAIGYLDPVTRRRHNLRILARACAKRLAIEGGRAVGIEVDREGGSEIFRGREIIVSAGAIHTPALLMRSGIGPAASLRALGVAVSADLPGVGGNLCEHPIVAVTAYLAPPARLKPETPRHMQVTLRYSSKQSGCPPVDMQVNCITRSAWHRLGGRLGTFQAWLNKPFSRGRVTLMSADWRAEPRVEFNLASDRRDLERLKDGMRFLARLVRSEPLGAVALDPFPSSYSERVRDINRVSVKNRFLTSLLAVALDGPAAIRRRLIHSLITRGVTLEGILADDEALEAFVRKSVTGIWHASCTCRMGRADDPLAVTDAAGRVRGVPGLRVVDASVMPEIPRANTGIPTIMIAEKMADAIPAIPA